MQHTCYVGQKPALKGALGDFLLPGVFEMAESIMKGDRGLLYCHS